MATREELIHEFERTTNQRRKAEIEDALWEGASAEERKGKDLRRIFLRDLLGVTTNASEARRAILGVGPDADILWNEVENNHLPLRTARVLLRQARELMHQDRRLRLDTALVRVLGQYNKLPNKVFARDGSVFRRGQNKYPEPPKDAPRKVRKSKKRELKFWDEMRHLSSQYFGQRLAEVSDPAVKDSMWKSFCADHDALMQEYQDRISWAMKEAKTGTKLAVNRTQVQKAARALSMDPPQPRQPIDLKVAKRHKNTAVRTYHPDVAGETTRAKFEEVIESYNLLVRYNEQLASGEYHG